MQPGELAVLLLHNTFSYIESETDPQKYVTTVNREIYMISKLIAPQMMSTPGKLVVPLLHNTF
jgi:hypothetical protein